ncbi:MAG: carboxypeptidase-like regulatory domain-containing protein [Planctomycetia bacterium]|nr:carboxypeptidase-like regulatory domain-containing protein [Planctomycetia bacterium]
MKITSRDKYIFCFFAAVLLITGCGNPNNLQRITGTVTLDGKPLEKAIVNFTPVGEGVPAAGETNSSGIYTLTSTLGDGGSGTQPGEYKVSIQKNGPEREWTEEEIAQAAKNPDKAPVIRNVNFIPTRYESPETSGFTATVVKGSNTFNFELSSK